MVAVGIVGEVLQGGLVFGWNALALMLQARNNFAGKCNPSERESLTHIPPSVTVFCCSDLLDPALRAQCILIGGALRVPPRLTWAMRSIA